MTFKTTIRQFLLFILLSLLTIASVAAENGKIPQRSEIDDAYKWKVEDIYSDTVAWEKDFEFIKNNINRFEKYKGHLGDSPQILLECLVLSDSLELILDNLYVYAYLKLDEDNRKSEFQELGGRAAGLNADFSAANAFIEPELLTIPGDKLQSFLKSTPELDLYRFYFDDLQRQKEHILSEKEEALLAAAGPMASTASNVFNMIDNADLKLGTIIDDDGNPLDLTWGRYSKIMEEGSREVRKAANDTVQNQYLKYANALAATLGGSIKKDLFFAKARGYNDCLEFSLSGGNIPTDVYYSLIDAVNANLEPLHKLTRLRKKILKVDTLYTYDMSVPLGPKSSKEYSFEEAQKMLLEGLKPLGKSYLKDFKKGFSAGWVDVYETEGKATGAYNWGTYSSHPYIMMNYTGRLDDVFTLAHEMGHAMNSYYTNQNEAYPYSGHALFTAEVASTCNEAVLMKYMMKNAKSKEEKIVLLNHYINQIKGTFFTQVMFAEFELAIHNRVEKCGAVSVDYFRKTYREIYQKYYGPELVIGENNDLTGMKISHFYRQYYVYQYATCYAAAQMLSQRILDGEKNILDTYQQFLATGQSAYPVDILKAAGVDLTKSEAVDRTLALFGELVDEMERLLDEN